MSNGSSPITACKKKLCELNPEVPFRCLQTQRTRRKQRAEPADPKSLERQVRQLLADKISGNQLGLWLLLPEHLRLAQTILHPIGQRPLLMADGEHFNGPLIEQVRLETPFDLLVPMPSQKTRQAKYAKLPSTAFTPHWAGFATAKRPFAWSQKSAPGIYEIIQRSGETVRNYYYKSFLATSDRLEVTDLSVHYPQRWHVEEFFKFNQALGWQRAGTLNLNIRYGHMTMALMAQAVLHQFRQRPGPPFDAWDAAHLAKDVFGGLEGDVRVQDDTIVVTYYNAPNVEQLRQHYQDLPAKLTAQKINPKIPWLYDFKLDFRFK